MDSPAATLDPFTQSFTWLDSYGTPFELSMQDLSGFIFESTKFAVGFGVTIGLSSLMFVTVLLLTQPGKRRSPIYILNLTTLFLDMLRGTMLAVYTTSGYSHPYAYFADDVTRVTNLDKSNNVAAGIFRVLESVSMFASLFLQVRVIMSTASRLHRALLSGFALILLLVSLALQLATTIVNTQNFLSPSFVDPDYYQERLDLQVKLATVTTAFQPVWVCVFLVIFGGKLGLVIWQRIKLGQTKFGPMQIVFIGTLQSMLVPAILLIVIRASSSNLSHLSTIATTLLAVQLPLTALWASTSLEERTTNLTPPVQAPYKRPFATGESDQSKKKGLLSKQSDDETTLKGSYGQLSPAKSDTFAGSGALKLESLPPNVTMRSLDVDVKMDERDMV